MKKTSIALMGAALLAVLATTASGGGSERTRMVEISAMIDDWHAAAAAADEKRYFGHISEDGVFLGTDATERWTKAEFLAYAHPHFAKGKAWSFTSTRRHITVAKSGTVAWFDEE